MCRWAIRALHCSRIVGHPFWKDEPGSAREHNAIQFLKNLGLIGGLLMVLTEKVTE